jgi:hypothetical protein
LNGRDEDVGTIADDMEHLAAGGSDNPSARATGHEAHFDLELPAHDGHARRRSGGRSGHSPGFGPSRDAPQGTREIGPAVTSRQNPLSCRGDDQGDC